MTLVLTALSRLLTIEIPATLVKPPPSPTNFPKTLPAEIVEKNPYDVDVVNAEILQAVRRLVLRVLVLTSTGIEKDPPPLPGTLVRLEPSPTNLA